MEGERLVGIEVGQGVEARVPEEDRGARQSTVNALSALDSEKSPADWGPELKPLDARPPGEQPPGGSEHQAWPSPGHE